MKTPSMILAGLLLAWLCSAYAQAAPPLEQLMQDNLSRLLSALDSSEREATLVARDIVDFTAITRGVIGRHSGELSQVQIVEFEKIFEQSVVRLLREVTTSIDTYQVSIERVSKRGDTKAQVLGVVVVEGGDRIELLTSLAYVDARWKVRNIIANGVNLGLTYRNQFDELMKTHDGNAAVVITAWSDALTLPESK